MKIKDGWLYVYFVGFVLVLGLSTVVEIGPVERAVLGALLTAFAVLFVARAIRLHKTSRV